MKRNSIKILVLLGAIASLGIIFIQMYWVGKAFNLEDKQFQQSVFIALKNVSEKLAARNYVPKQLTNPVNQVSSNYYVVNINSGINANLLEYYLKSEFSALNINTDFEYAIYDCDQNKMVYGNYIKVLESGTNAKPTSQLPTYNQYTYYFGVNFPQRTKYLVQNMDIWIVTSLFLFLVIAFFVYALFVVLEQKRYSEVQKDFINNLTHEFKTPISTISISASALSRSDVNSNMSKLLNYVGIITKEANRLNQHVENILNINKVSQNDFQLQKECLDAHVLIHEIANDFETSMKEKGAILILSLKADRTMIDTDRLHFTNLLYNLIDNALKYSPVNPHIEIITENMAQSLQISIKDNGIGINKEYHKKVFLNFFRVPTGNLHNVKGFGIGLSYVKSILDAHKWKISLESELGKGSTFKIIIPN
jgi:two-component system, OmpR family, phosphate regulon sensor histidine kinase PhoR